MGAFVQRKTGWTLQKNTRGAQFNDLLEKQILAATNFLCGDNQDSSR